MAGSGGHPRYHPEAQTTVTAANIQFITRDEVTKISNDVLGRPDIPMRVEEQIFRIDVADLPWDIGVRIYESEHKDDTPLEPSGNKIGVFLLHGGSSDFRGVDSKARLLTAKFGYKVVSMTFPGRLYFPDPETWDWPGDTMEHPISPKKDGIVRTPIWHKGQEITPDQYVVVGDASSRERYGTLIMARALKGTAFYDRMAAWPWAFEEAMKTAVERNLPAGEYAVYVNGHSTGGPFAQYLSQRVQNLVGQLGMESTPFGYIFAEMTGRQDDPETAFTDLRVRTWRDTARYAGPEALATGKGNEALSKLAKFMEEVFESWDRGTSSPKFKAEDPVHFSMEGTLTKAAMATAERLGMNAEQTGALVKKYLSYGRELSGESAKPVPPQLFGLSIASRDHTPEIYRDIVVRRYAAMEPAPDVRLVQFGAGTHGFMNAEQGLPLGVGPAVAHYWHDAIMEGYFADYAAVWAVSKGESPDFESP